jgi:hypothetical protein
MLVAPGACGFACAMERYRSERLVRGWIGYGVTCGSATHPAYAARAVSGLAFRLALAGHSVRARLPT